MKLGCARLFYNFLASMIPLLFAVHYIIMASCIYGIHIALTASSHIEDTPEAMLEYISLSGFFAHMLFHIGWILPGETPKFHMRWKQTVWYLTPAIVSFTSLLLFLFLWKYGSPWQSLGETFSLFTASSASLLLTSLLPIPPLATFPLLRARGKKHIKTTPLELRTIFPSIVFALGILDWLLGTRVLQVLWTPLIESMLFLLYLGA